MSANLPVIRRGQIVRFRHELPAEFGIVLTSDEWNDHVSHVAVVGVFPRRASDVISSTLLEVSDRLVIDCGWIYKLRKSELIGTGAVVEGAGLHNLTRGVRDAIGLDRLLTGAPYQPLITLNDDWVAYQGKVHWDKLNPPDKHARLVVSPTARNHIADPDKRTAITVMLTTKTWSLEHGWGVDLKEQVDSETSVICAGDIRTFTYDQLRHGTPKGVGQPQPGVSASLMVSVAKAIEHALDLRGGSILARQ